MKQHQAASQGVKPLTRRSRAKVINPLESVYYGHYDLTEFIAKYGLTPLDARQIFERIGPARTDLDRYMRMSAGN